MGILSPSKYMTRQQLRQILRDNCIAASGAEYCESEVIDLLHEKETRLAAQDYDRAWLDYIATKDPNNGGALPPPIPEKKAAPPPKPAPPTIHPYKRQQLEAIQNAACMMQAPQQGAQPMQQQQRATLAKLEKIKRQDNARTNKALKDFVRVMRQDQKDRAKYKAIFDILEPN